MTSSKPKKWLWIFCPEMTLSDVPEIPKIGAKENFLNLNLWTERNASFWIPRTDKRLKDPKIWDFFQANEPNMYMWTGIERFDETDFGSMDSQPTPWAFSTMLKRFECFIEYGSCHMTHLTWINMILSLACEHYPDMSTTLACSWRHL